MYNQYNALRPPEKVGKPPLSDGRYEVESIANAYKVKNRWWFTVKWIGWTQVTPEPKSVLLKGAGPEVRAMAAQAIARATLRQGGIMVDDEEDEEPGADPDEDESEEESPDRSGEDLAQVFLCSSVMAVRNEVCEGLCKRFISTCLPLLA